MIINIYYSQSNYTLTELIPERSLGRFLHRQADGRKLLVVAITGAHAYGYPHQDSPLVLLGIHVEPTESLVGLHRPHGMDNWVDEFEGHRLDYSSYEVGEALERLLRGDGTILERIMAPRQLIAGHDLSRLRGVARGAVSRRFHTHYRNFCRGVLDTWEEKRPSLQHMLSIYRTALTGIHLLRAGKLELDLPKLAQEYGLTDLPARVRESRLEGERPLDAEEGPWLRLLVRFSALLEDAYDQSPLPREPKHPELAEEYVLDIRRRFFDALTVQD